MKRKIIISVVVLLLLILCGLVIWKSQPASITTVESTAPTLHEGYVVKNDMVYYVTLSPQTSEYEIKGADASSFIPLENGWGKDSSNVYYNGYLTHPADTFVPTIHTSSFTSIPDTFYAKDDQAVYFPSFVNNSDGTSTYTYNVFPDADPGSFVIVEPLMYAKDKTHVWNIEQGEGGPTRELMVGVNPANCTAENLKGCEGK